MIFERCQSKDITSRSKMVRGESVNTILMLVPIFTEIPEMEKEADQQRGTTPRERRVVSPEPEPPTEKRETIRRHKSGPSTEDDGPGPTPGSPSKRHKSRSPPGHNDSIVHFVSGNPTVELVKGVLHLYKER